MPARIPLDHQKIAEFCKRYHVRKLSLFGSVLRDDFGPQSDVDVLVEFEPGRTPGYFTIGAMINELTGVCGRKADVRTVEDLSRYFRDEVTAQAEPVYVQG